MNRKLKNVTITLDEQTAQWTRIEAARRDQSVSRFVAELLHDQMRGADEYEQAKERYLRQRPGVHGERGRPYPKRDELHDRRGLR